MKVYIPKIKEDWIIDRIRKEWYESSKDISTKISINSDIIWINAPWAWSKIKKVQLKNKLVLCTIHHIDEKKFSELENNFYKLDSYVDFYHVPSLKTLEQLKRLTSKKIFHIPYWVNHKNFYYIDDKLALRKKYGFEPSHYLVGSFQRDTEGSDLKSPKLIKGPDIFIKSVSYLYKKNTNLKVVLTGKRRQYVINELNRLNIPFNYFEMIDGVTLNDLYNVLDLYIVSSRIEGGPQAILECAISKTPVVSTDVGIAGEVLHRQSIYNDKINDALPNVEFAYKNSEKLELNNLIKEYSTMFEKIYKTRNN